MPRARHCAIPWACLLADELGIQLRPVRSGTRKIFVEGEQALSAWMADNAFVSVRYLILRPFPGYCLIPGNIQPNAGTALMGRHGTGIPGMLVACRHSG
jgi:hypothetical protein